MIRCRRWTRRSFVHFTEYCRENALSLYIFSSFDYAECRGRTYCIMLHLRWSLGGHISNTGFQKFEGGKGLFEVEAVNSQRPRSQQSTTSLSATARKGVPTNALRGPHLLGGGGSKSHLYSMIPKRSRALDRSGSASENGCPREREGERERERKEFNRNRHATEGR